MTTDQDKFRRRLVRLRWAVFALGVAMSLLWTFALWPRQSAVQLTDDIYRFAALGSNLAHGLGFAYEPGHPTLRRAPFYPAFIAVLYLIGGDHPFLIRLAQCLLAGGICLLAFEIGRLLFGSRAGFLAGILCALHPMIFRYAADIQVENVLTFLFTLTLWGTVRFVERPTLARGAFIGLAGALAALTKGVVLTYPPVFAAYYLARSWMARRHLHEEERPARHGGETAAVPWGALAAILVVMGAVTLPWTARNRLVSGLPVLVSSNAGGEFLRGYVFAQPKYYLLRARPYVEGENEANRMEADLFAQQGLVWERDEAETERVLNREARKKLAQEPLAFARKFFIGLFMFWYVVTTRMNSVLVGGLALAGWVFALIGWRQARQERRNIWLLFLPILCMNLTYAAMLALGRYSAPCIPALMILAAWGVETLLARRRR
jgi:4-amino-4-deoxy-L-arabinose transferase-like glycosyltransferase